MKTKAQRWRIVKTAGRAEKYWNKDGEKIVATHINIYFVCRKASGQLPDSDRSANKRINQ